MEDSQHLGAGSFNNKGLPAYLIKDEQEELLMESVDIVEPIEQEGFRLVDIFGVQKTVKARITSMNLVNHKILFEEQGL
jgi:predicted RNA-binding protein